MHKVAGGKPLLAHKGSYEMGYVIMHGIALLLLSRSGGTRVSVSARQHGTTLLRLVLSVHRSTRLPIHLRLMDTHVGRRSLLLPRGLGSEHLGEPHAKLLLHGQQRLARVWVEAGSRWGSEV